MKILAILFLVFGIIVTLGANYYMYKIAKAIWFPKKSSKKWLEVAESPIIKYSFFFKWLAPIMVITFTLNVFIELIKCLA